MYGAEQRKGVNGMIETRYARIMNEETKEIQVGVGCPDEYYIEIGMTEMEVEQAYNGLWYVAGYAPIKPIPTIEEQNAEISKRREFLYEKEIDGLHARKQRKTILGTWTDEDEANYIAEVKRLSAKIEEENPYVV
jgi:hypothetical protein